VLLSLAAKAGLMGIPILTSWFFKYAYIPFDHTVRGFDEPPTLDIQMLNPLDEQRPLAQVAILGLIYVTVIFAKHTMGPTSVLVIAVVSARLIDDPLFRPKSAAATLQIARIAAAGGGAPRVARTLLADFPARFADDPSVAAATALARHLGT
jgi:hypothetical protein